MPRYFDDDFLRRLRNDISWASLLNQLGWPHKQREGQRTFLCPRCHEYLSAVSGELEELFLNVSELKPLYPEYAKIIEARS